MADMKAIFRGVWQHSKECKRQTELLGRIKALPQEMKDQIFEQWLESFPAQVIMPAEVVMTPGSKFNNMNAIMSWVESTVIIASPSIGKVYVLTRSQERAFWKLDQDQQNPARETADRLIARSKADRKAAENQKRQSQAPKHDVH